MLPTARSTAAAVRNQQRLHRSQQSSWHTDERQTLGLTSTAGASPPLPLLRDGLYTSTSSPARTAKHGTTSRGASFSLSLVAEEPRWCSKSRAEQTPRGALFPLHGPPLQPSEINNGFSQLTLLLARRRTSNSLLDIHGCRLPPTLQRELVSARLPLPRTAPPKRGTTSRGASSPPHSVHSTVASTTLRH